MTNYPADESEDHTAPRHAGALADDLDGQPGVHDADADADQEQVYADLGARDLDVNDPDLIVVNDTVATSADAEDGDLDDPSAAPSGGAFAVDGTGTTEPAAPDTSTAAGTEGGGGLAHQPATDSAYADADTTDADISGADDTGVSPADVSDGTADVGDQPVATEPVAAGEPAPDVAAPDATTGPPQVADPAGSDAHELQERWLAIQSDFVNDPHRSVAAAADLVQQAIDRMVADLKQRESSMRGNWDSSSADTEALRKALVDYRQFLDRLAAV
jgi:hypothetical protein